MKTFFLLTLTLPVFAGCIAPKKAIAPANQALCATQAVNLQMEPVAMCCQWGKAKRNICYRSTEVKP